MRKLDLATLAEAVLLKMYEHATKVGGRLELDEICQMFQVQVTSTFVTKALDRLTSKAFVSIICPMMDPVSYEIEDAGIVFAQAQQTDPNSVISELIHNGDSWLDESATNSKISDDIGLSTETNESAVPDFKEFRENLLIAFFQKSMASGADIIDLKTVADEARLDYPEGWVSKAAYSFRDHGYINEAFTMDGGPDGNHQGEITAEGIEEAQELLNLRSTSEINAESIGIPASDRVVALDHNSPDYKEAVSSLEGVIHKFKEDQHLDNELGHEKGALLKALEGGRELLDDTSINLRIGVALLIEPLKRITQKYDQVLVGALAAAAITAILKLFGVG